MIFEETIRPYIGTDSFKLYQPVESVIKILNDNNIQYTIDKDAGEDCTPPEPWTIIEIKDTMTLYFTDKNNKLFKIGFESKYKGKLENGIDFSWSMNDVKKFDKTIEYEDFEEVWLSKNGYWIETHCDETNKIFSIQIFIKEIDNDDFPFCKW